MVLAAGVYARQTAIAYTLTLLYNNSKTYPRRRRLSTKFFPV